MFNTNSTIQIEGRNLRIVWSTHRRARAEGARWSVVTIMRSMNDDGTVFVDCKGRTPRVVPLSSIATL